MAFTLSPVTKIGSSLAHPRTIGWFGTTAVAMGGINQSLFLTGALFVGQGAIPGQGSAAVLLLIVGLLLSWAATPGWTELILMYPNRVGGIAATCAEAFRPYSPILANLTGVCYWWGWVPTCGLTALLSASAINQWYMPHVPVPLLATIIVLAFTLAALCGVKWIMRLAMPIATGSAVLAFLSALVPIASGTVDWQQAFTFHLTVPFSGWFGKLTSFMAGLYLVGFAAPAFEQAACHVGETINPNKNVPRAMFASAAMASVYFIILPIVWLGALGPEPLGKDLALVLGPTFAPLLGGAAKSAAIWFMMLNMFHGTIAPLAGAARTLAQLAEDGLLPEFLAKRSGTDAPWVATLLTAVMSIAFLWIGDPVWLIAAANLTYLIGIGMPNVAVWLLRKNRPELTRPYRAPRGTIMLGLVAAGVWGIATILGFQQFGLQTVIVGIAFAYSGSALYAWRKAADRRKLGLPIVARTLHLKLTGAMLLVLSLDAFGYAISVAHVPTQETALITVLEDIFVLVALLTISVGLILPGMIAHSAVEVSREAERLVKGTLADFTRAMRALSTGNLEAAQARFDFHPLVVHSRDEVGDMALTFNTLQEEIGRAAEGLEGARNGLLAAREVTESNIRLRLELAERQRVEKEVHERSALLDQAPNAVLVTDLADRIVYLNPSAERLYGRTLADFAGAGSVAGIYKNAAEFQAAKKQLLESGEWRGEFAQVAGDGSDLIVESRWVLLRDLDDHPKSILLINTDIAERKEAEATLESLNAKLRDVSRRAGMAEVATNVIQNVGNVLNSVNVSGSLLSDRVRKSRTVDLAKAVAMIEDHKENLGHFFGTDPKGKQLLKFLHELAVYVDEEQSELLKELDLLVRNVEHIRAIVSMQQNHARASGTAEVLSAIELVEDVLKMNAALIERHQIHIVREYAEVPSVIADRHKVVQILINLLQNASQALDEKGRADKELKLSVSLNGNDCVKIRLIDNGIGIEPANLTRIFAHGFTTRADGHGFGLHSGALAAKEMGGSLSAHSEGMGKGASFELELPIEKNNDSYCN